MTQQRTTRLTLGSRGSPLALAQTHETRQHLCKTYGWAEDEVAIKTYTTTGDQIQDRALVAVGGKGLFTKELEDALLNGEIDVAVHSAKDMPAHLPQGLVLPCCLPREDARDCLITKNGVTLKDLPQGAVIGSSSPRRVALMLRARPDFKIVNLRGNVDTRIAKIERGEADATLLAHAGLRRLGREHAISEVLPIDVMLPAVAQGIIVLQTRAIDQSTRLILDQINHVESYAALLCERAFLKELDGSCRTPLAGYATLHAEQIHFRGLILSLDGKKSYEHDLQGAVKDAETIGQEVARALKAQAPVDFFAQAS